MIFLVGNSRTCAASFVDSAGIRHSIEVAAESLYEAAALAVNEFRRHPWTDGIEPGLVTVLEVNILTRPGSIPSVQGCRRNSVIGRTNLLNPINPKIRLP